MFLEKIEQKHRHIATAISSNGFEFNYLDNSWRVNRNTTVKLNFLDNFDEGLAKDIRETLVYYAENGSGGALKAHAERLRKYQEISGEAAFTELGFHLFKSSVDKKNEYIVATVRTFIRQMRYLGLDGRIDDSVYELTGQWRLSAGERGVPVLSLDPISGPFSSLEFEAIGYAAAHKYAERKITIEQYALILLFKATGRRPEQIATLKIKDFSYSSQFTGKPTYVGNIPRIKQRGGGFRAEFRLFGFANNVAQIVESHIKSAVLKVENALGRKLTEQEKAELPVFHQKKILNEMISLADGSLIEFLLSELAHVRSHWLGQQLVSAFELLEIRSERTGEALHCNPYRFRYTLGTRAAIEGAGTITIATLLDHSDTQHVNVYVANIPEYAVEISKIMNQPLAQYASAFAGRIVKDEREANHENRGASRIPCHEKDCDVGSCGSDSFCQDYAPIACYQCYKFRPWADAPHHLVLEWLMEERERLIKSTDCDLTVVSINDRAIIAVCQVIKLVQEYNHGQ